MINHVSVETIILDMVTYTVQLLSSSEDEYIVRSSRNNLTMKREN